MSKKNALIIVYTHIEGYPPSLNALNELAKSFDTIQVLVINNQKTAWKYPKNVALIECGTYFPTSQIANKKFVDKIKDFTQFIALIKKLLQDNKINIVVAYDPISLFAYCMLSKFLSKKDNPLLWYHNHDVMELSKTKKYSIAWAAALVEKNIFDKLDFFSLPAQDRKQYFPLEKLKGKYFYTPNVPAKSFYGSYYTPKILGTNTVKIVYQGSLAKGQGFERLINLVENNKCSKKILFDIKTFHSYSEYNENINKLLVEKGLEKDVRLLDTSPYAEMPDFTKQYDIGLAIFSETSILRSTAGTASNKIYEYIAVGLPVILFDNEHFREHLGKYEWAFFTDLSEKSLLDCIEKIIANYEYLSQKAHEDFETHLNFETYFAPVMEEVMKEINK